MVEGLFVLQVLRDGWFEDAGVVEGAYFHDHGIWKARAECGQ